MEHVDILLVEDNPQDADMTMRALRKKHLSNPLHWVKDGQEAMDFLCCEGSYMSRKIADQPKLVLLDISMPKLNGLEVLARVKQIQSLKAIPIVIMTSSAEEPDVAKAYELGANSYIVKPIQSDDFAEMIATVGLYWTTANLVPDSVSH